jgi:hypothetical protein
MVSIVKVDTLQNLNSSTIITQHNITTIIIGTSGQTVDFVGNDATIYASPSVTRNSNTSLTARINSSVTNANEPYIVKVTNPSSLYAESSEQININAGPVFTTPSGSLGTLTSSNSGAANLTAVVATDPEGTTITYTIFSGSIPTGITFNSNGTWSGTAAAETSDTTYNFVVQASDGINATTRSFSIAVLAPVATGGSITTSGAYTYHTFASSGTFVVNKTYTMDYLIVAGGGSGGTGRAGGGGAGGYIATDAASIAPGSYTVTIGGGGSGSGQDTPGNTGNPSSVFSVTANGGGYGGGWNSRSGGSGGSGGGPSTSGSPGSGTSGQGNNAGTTNDITGGGGGGKGEAGNTDGQGYGGDGATWYDGVTRGGGGGGGANFGSGQWGYGGDGGGTNGESSRGTSAAGAANTGGGSGGTEGGGGRSGTGGSGIVVIRYLS